MNSHYHLFHLSPQLLKRVELALMGLALCLLVFTAANLTIFAQQYRDRFYPEVYIDQIALTGKTTAEARELFTHSTPHSLPPTVTLELGEIKLSSSTAELNIHKNYDRAIAEAFKVGRTQPFFLNWTQRLFPTKKHHFTAEVVVDDAKLTSFIETFKKQVDVAGSYPQATLKYTESPGSLSIHVGKIGQVLNMTETKSNVQNALNQNLAVVTPAMTQVGQELSETEKQASLERAKKLVSKKLIVRADHEFEELNDQVLISLLAFPQGLAETRVEELVNKLKTKVDRPAQDGAFAYDKNTLQVTSFKPPRPGLELNKTEFQGLLSSAFQNLENTTEKSQELKLAVTTAQPKSLAETNDLGIKERIGFGESQYFHSIPSRIYNVALTAKKINNTIIKPGEEFSFNRALGDVSAATGFQPAYVIRNGRTELGDGGGVCQVSTTVFRAALNAGLPITKRHAHSYRVSYYELNSKPGVDATVYSGDIDLRFVNDTGNHLLIHTETDSSELYMTVEIFGTSDGRSTEIVDHKTWGFQAAPPASYVDDPSLRRGQVKQVDFAASGIKASFKNVVKDKTGKVIREEEFFSNYKPWRAIFLRGIG